VNRIANILVLAAIGMALSACGFHLRGDADLPPAMERTNLALADENGELGRALRPLLESAGADLVSAEEAGATLVVSRDHMEREILTVGRQARVSEFQLRYQVDFSLRDAAGEALMSERSLELTRDFTFDEASVLGKANEEELLREELYGDMARLILFHLSQAAPAS
jgi:LPS-assembly lipoprotein